MRHCSVCGRTGHDARRHARRNPRVDPRKRSHMYAGDLFSAPATPTRPRRPKVGTPEERAEKANALRAERKHARHIRSHGAGDYSGRHLPTFGTYAEAVAYANRRHRAYPTTDRITDQYGATPEYHALYAVMKRLQAEERADRRAATPELLDAARAAMAAVGVRYGDRVAYKSRGIFFGAEPIYGKLTNRAGVPTVVMDHKQPTTGGGYRKSVPWTKGWGRA